MANILRAFKIHRSASTFHINDAFIGGTVDVLEEKSVFFSSNVTGGWLVDHSPIAEGCISCISPLCHHHLTYSAAHRTRRGQSKNDNIISPATVSRERNVTLFNVTKVFNDSIAKKLQKKDDCGYVLEIY